MKINKSIILLASILTCSVAFAQTAMTRGKLHYVGTFTAADLKQRALRMPQVTKFIAEEKEGPDRGDLPMNPASPKSSSFPLHLNDGFLDPLITNGRHDGSPLFSLGAGFNGPDRTVSVDPPDTVGDVSTTQVVVATNANFTVYDKTGVVGALNQSMDSFFSPARSGTSIFTSDPRVRFDRLSGRWFFVAVDIPSGSFVNNRCMIVVSNNSVLDGSSTYKYYWFQPRLATDGFDYPTLGVDNNALYIGGNMFGGGTSFSGSDAYVVTKAPLLSGAGGALSVFSSQVCTSAGEGPYTPQGVLNGDPSTTEGYFVGVSNAAFGRLVVRRITTPGAVPAISANLLVTVPSTFAPNATVPKTLVPTPGGNVDALDDRLFNAMYSNGSIWCSHNFTMTAAGVATNVSGSRIGSRWYQLGNLTTVPNLTQSGTAFDGAGTPQNYWIPSVAANLQGHAVLGSSRANSTTTPGSGFAVRNLTDSLGTMTAPALAHGGTGTYTPGGNRWGDYSHVVIDPSDGMTFWSFQEYIPAAGKWGTWVQQIKSNPPTVTLLTPNNGTQGQTLNVVVSGTDLFDPGAGYPNHLTSTFGSNITINSTTYNSPTQATVNITIGGAAATGARTITMTNPDGQSVNSSFTVNLATKTVSGTLTLQGYVGALGSLQFIYELRDSGTNALIETQTITGLGAGGTFSFNTTQPAGNYNLRIRGVNRFLAKSQVITMTSSGVSGLTYTLLNGDADGNNVVAINDFNILKAAWGGVAPSAPYNVAADFDGNGVIAVTDFNILRANWGVIGDN